MDGLAGQIDWSAPSPTLRAAAPHVHHDPSRQLSVFLLGRIDQIRGLDDSGSAAARVADAYFKWGAEMAGRLYGDFAIVIWDAGRREIVCVRDALGVCPFYYASSPGSFAFATALEPLTHIAGVSLAPNEGFIAELLSAQVVSKSDTLYAGIQRLAPGCLLRATSRGVSVQSYWSPQDYLLQTPQAGNRTERFRALLDAAVARRFSQGCTAVEVSGGLDSSSVAALAQKNSSTPVSAYSVLFADPRCDERAFAQAVVEHSRMDWKPVDAAEISLETLRDFARRHRTLPLHPTAATGRTMLNAIRAAGCSSVLTGHGGDDLISGNAQYSVELLRSFRWLEFARQSRSGPDAPGVLRALRRHVPAMLRSGSAAADSGCVSADLAKRVDLAGRIAMPELPHELQTPCLREMCEHLHSGAIAMTLEEHPLTYGDAGLAVWHPFYDRELYEFCLSLPESDRQQGRVGKQILRRAMVDALPDSVLSRTDKGEFSGTLQQAVESADKDLQKLNRLKARGWVDAQAADTLFQQARSAKTCAGGRRAEDLHQAWTFMALEVWLQQYEQSSNNTNQQHREDAVAYA